MAKKWEAEIREAHHRAAGEKESAAGPRRASTLAQQVSSPLERCNAPYAVFPAKTKQ